MMLAFCMLNKLKLKVYSGYKAIYTVRHKLSIASIVSLKHKESFPVMNIFFIFFIRIDKLVTMYT